MGFFEVLNQVIELLQREGRISYRALKRELSLDDAYLDDLKAEIIQAKKLAVDEDGAVLVWTGNPAPASSSVAAAAPTPPSRPPLTYTPIHLAEKILHARPTLEGERKQVTVLFADIKDSTELIRGLDPEAAQQLLDPAIHRMMDAVHRFEGTVNQVLGDGIMALFGAPIAHEDHALRACYAALAMQAAMRPYTEEVRRTQGLELRIRVGLNAGEVVVRAIGNDLHMDYSAVGETTHLAARMEQLATPGTIRLSATTLRLVEGLIQVTALGPIPVKGLEEPVEVFELLGASSTRRRLQAAVARGLTPFVGRQQELDVLSRARARARAGHGQVVALVGEAGVGKSRLVYECLHAPSLQGWRVLEASSVSYGKATPYFPVVDLLKRYAQVDDADAARIRRAKLTGHVLTLDTTLQDTLEPLLALLEALPEDSAFLHLDPPQRRQRTLQALRRLLLHESQMQPLLLVFEDLHWIDAETQALLDSLVERLPTAQLLLLVNYRPEYQHGWGSKTTYTQLRLDPLEPAGAAQVVQALLGDDASLEALKQLLIERTEGNPFFLEESVRTLVETGVLAGKPGAYRLVQTLSTIRVPATVQAVLAARIDRLAPEAKHLLQTAAVIGYEVSWALLQAIADLPEADVHRGLAQLQSAEFLYETRLFPEREFTFKHALTHEVAYSSLLQERRRVLHGRIVEALETFASERLTEQVDRLAHHAVRGELWDKAVAYCRQAGAKATTQSAYREAAASFEQALQALTHLPEDRETRVLGIDLRFDLRNVLAPLGEVERILAILREAETLAEALGEHRRLGLVSRFMARHFWLMHEYDDAIASGQRALTLATQLKDFALQMAAHNILGGAYHAVGDYARAVTAYGHVVASLEGELLYERFGLAMPPSIDARTNLAVCLAETGAFAEGLTHAQAGLRLAEAVDHAFGLTQAYLANGVLRLRQGAFPEAIPMLERALGVCQDANVMLYLADTTAALGYAYALCGRIAEALPLLEQAVQQAPAVRGGEGQALRLAYLSEAYMLSGRLQEARLLAQRAHELSRAYKERRCEAYVLHLLGDIAMHSEPADVTLAETQYQQALALANALGMRPLAAHCHRSLGTLYTTTGQSEQARHELSAALDLYRAMQMTFWLPQTEVALATVFQDKKEA